MGWCASTCSLILCSQVCVCVCVCVRACVRVCVCVYMRMFDSLRGLFSCTPKIWYLTTTPWELISYMPFIYLRQTLLPVLPPSLLKSTTHFPLPLYCFKVSYMRCATKPLHIQCFTFHEFCPPDPTSWLLFGYLRLLITVQGCMCVGISVHGICVLVVCVCVHI